MPLFIDDKASSGLVLAIHKVDPIISAIFFNK